MNYSNTYTTQYMRVKMNTNSHRIYKLIENFLDFNNNINHPRPKINVEFYLESIVTKNFSLNQNFTYHGWSSKKKILLASVGNESISVSIDPKAAQVKGLVVNYNGLSKEPTLGYVFIHPLRFILTHHGLFSIHASMVSKGSDCIFISGNQNCGKSTLAFTLLQNGFTLLADDACFIKLKGNEIQAFPLPTKMGLQDNILKKYPQFSKYVLKNYRYGEKRRLSLNSISQDNNTKGYKCKMVVFPIYKANSKVYIKRISKDEALDRLAKENIYVYSPKELKKLSCEHFWTLYNLTRKANLFELAYNDDRLNDIPKIIKEIF